MNKKELTLQISGLHLSKRGGNFLYFGCQARLDIASH